MKLGDRLVQLRKEKNYTREDFAKLLGISKYTLRNYELGVTEPGHPFLIKIAELFNTSIDYILGLTEEREILHSYELKALEYDHIKKYRSLDDSGKKHIDYELDRECERIQQIEEMKKQLATELSEEIAQVCTYPYLGKIACAGTGFYFDDIPTDTIKAPYVEGADFIIGVSGESMEPDYHDGEKLYVRKVEYLRNGDVGIFTIGNECFLKELAEDGLISRNKNYDDIPGDEKVRLIGKVIGKVVI